MRDVYSSILNSNAGGKKTTITYNSRTCFVILIKRARFYNDTLEKINIKTCVSLRKFIHRRCIVQTVLKIWFTRSNFKLSCLFGRNVRSRDIRIEIFDFVLLGRVACILLDYCMENFQSTVILLCVTNTLQQILYLHQPQAGVFLKKKKCGSYLAFFFSRQN